MVTPCGISNNPEKTRATTQGDAAQRSSKGLLSMRLLEEGEGDAVGGEGGGEGGGDVVSQVVNRALAGVSVVLDDETQECNHSQAAVLHLLPLQFPHHAG
jgi:hypothetical protein